MSAYYNENDKFAAAWLRELIKAGLIADGEVDDRSIADVTADDVRGFVQYHFFAGIGGWSYALRLAGWPDDREVWTGSCPCQPWSVAGKGEGADDPRHLWPAWSRLIEVCRPAVIFGEQVAGEDGRYWLDLVFADMEARDYAIAAFDLPACSIGAPHKRSRLWFVADSHGEQLRAVGSGEVARQACAAEKAEKKNGNGFGMTLGNVAKLAHWTTPNAVEQNESPAVKDARNQRHRARGSLKGVGGYKLSTQAMLASWATPTARDWRSDRMVKSEAERYGTKVRPLARQALHADSGNAASGSTTMTAFTVLLNPNHSRWLQGYPATWSRFTPTAMPSSRKSRKPSSKRIST